MEQFEKLHAYQAAYKLCLGTYKITAGFPDTEKFAMTSQMRRAAYSVISNIAEGSRKSAKERRHFNQIAIGSLDELKAFYKLASDLGYCTQVHVERATKLASDTGKMLVGLNKKLLV